MNAKKHRLIATAWCHPIDEADNHGVAEGEDGYFNGTTGLPVGIHLSTFLLCGNEGKAAISDSRRGLKISCIYPTKSQTGKPVAIWTTTSCFTETFPRQLFIVCQEGVFVSRPCWYGSLQKNAVQSKLTARSLMRCEKRNSWVEAFLTNLQADLTSHHMKINSTPDLTSID